MSQAITETIKEGVRIAFLAALGALITWASSKVASFDPTSVQYIVAALVIKLADKYVHENENINLKGISPV